MIISYGYMGTLSGDPSALISLRRIFPSLEATIAVDFGTSRAITRTPSSSGDPSAASRSMVARAGTGGIVLFDTSAESPVASACASWMPVGVPSSSTPRYRTPPSVLLRATTVSTSSLSGNLFRSLLNSQPRSSFWGISRLPVIDVLRW